MADRTPPSPEYAEPYLRILENLCRTQDFESVAAGMLLEISSVIGCEAVALRVRDQKGDYPYFVYHGFEQRFIEKESPLCHRDEDGRVVTGEDGRPVLECMCGAVLRRQCDPSKPFFTENGSFWTNCTSELLAATTEKDRGRTTRNMCNIWGYESVALVPIRADDADVGLLQCNSRQRGRFTPEMIQFLERLGLHAGSAIAFTWRRRELSQLAGELEQQQRGLESALAMGEMTSVLAHDLKTPLAGVMLAATRLKRHTRKEGKQGQIVDQLISSVNAVDDTIKGMMSLVKVPTLEPTTTDINRLLESTVSVIAPIASMKGIGIIWDLAPAPPMVTADARFLSRAFLNLLTNALDAIEGEGSIRITTSKVDDDQVEVAIADTGRGIGTANAGELFAPFHTTKPGGSGLGLSIVKRVVELHSGSVTLAPRSGTKGTEAIIRIPCALEGRNPVGTCDT